VERITSLQNPKIKNVIKLQKASERREQKLFLVEGLKEINLAVEGGFKLNSLFWNPDLGVKQSKIEKILNLKNSVFKISADIFDKIAYREGSDGVVGVFEQKMFHLDDLVLPENPLVIILETIEKPGNLGAIMRTAEAASVNAVLVCDQKIDIFNPNVIRSSIGCLFTKKVIVCSNDEALKWIIKNKITIYAALLSSGSKPFYNFDYTKPTAFIMGSEAEGLSDFWIKNSDEKIIIPMMGKSDSLNVSVSAAILAYEAVRQRSFTLKI